MIDSFPSLNNSYPAVTYILQTLHFVISYFKLFNRLICNKRLIVSKLLCKIGEYSFNCFIVTHVYTKCITKKEWI